jgi:hypothetical protein
VNGEAAEDDGVSCFTKFETVAWEKTQITTISCGARIEIVGTHRDHPMTLSEEDWKRFMTDLSVDFGDGWIFEVSQIVGESLILGMREAE